MKSSTLVAAVVGILVAVAGLIVYSLVSYNLVNMNFTIQSNQAIVNTINLNLGTLSAGTSGSTSTSTTITINKGGEYIFYLANTQELQGEFSTFLITISYLNSTQSTTITLGWPNAGYNDTVYLAPGTYNLNIELQYTVYSNATSMTFNGTVVKIGYV